MGLKGKTLLSLLTLVGFLAVSLVGCQPKKPAEEPATSEAVVQEQEEPTPVAEAPAPVKEAPAPVVEAAPESASSKEIHTVEKGDCLWTISEGADVYNDPFKWPLIYKENRDQIKDPDLIYPDQKFSIPRDSSGSEVDDAVHEAKTRGPWSLWDGK